MALLVSNLACCAGKNKVRLSWTNPVSAFDHITVTAKQNTAPVDPDDGIKTNVGSGITFEHTGIALGGSEVWKYKVYVFTSPTAYDNTVTSKTGNPDTSGYPGPFSITGTVKDQAGNPIVLGADTWVAEATSNPGYSGTPVVYPYIETTTPIDITGYYQIDVQTSSPTDDIVWPDDVITVTIKKNSLVYAMTQFTATVLDVQNGGKSIDVQEPSNINPVPPSVFSGGGGTWTESPTPNRTPDLIWKHVIDAEPGSAANPIHYAVEIAQSHSGSGGEIISSDTGYLVFTSASTGANSAPDQFTYSVNSGASWSTPPFPSGGLVLASANTNRVKFTVPLASQLALGTWYWQVRATDMGVL